MDDDKAVEGCLLILFWALFSIVLGSFWGDYAIHFWLVKAGIKQTIPYWVILISAIPLGKFYWGLGILTCVLSWVL